MKQLNGGRRGLKYVNGSRHGETAGCLLAGVRGGRGEKGEGTSFVSSCTSNESIQ